VGPFLKISRRGQKKGEGKKVVRARGDIDAGSGGRGEPGNTHHSTKKVRPREDASGGMCARETVAL